MRAELLQLLGVSPTRLVHLQREPDWPEPAAELIADKLYRYADIQAWADKRGRILHPSMPPPSRVAGMQRGSPSLEVYVDEPGQQPIRISLPLGEALRLSRRIPQLIDRVTIS